MIIELDVEVPNLAEVEVETPQTEITPSGGATVLLVATPGPPGAAGAGATVTLTAGETLSGHRVVMADDAGELVYASSMNVVNAHRPMWFTTGATVAGAAATVLISGPVVEPSWTWTPGVPIYLGDNGFPTQTIPSGAAFVLIVADVINPTTLAFRPGAPIITEG